MNFYSYEGLQELANSKCKAVCAWTPKNPPLSHSASQDPTVNWVHDTEGNPKTYLDDVSKFSEKIVVFPNNTRVEPAPEDLKVFEVVRRNDKRKNPEKRKFRHILKEEALKLGYGDSVFILDRNGQFANAKINGKVRTWKRDANRIEIPCKYGMYEYFTLNQGNFTDIIIPVE